MKLKPKCLAFVSTTMSFTEIVPPFAKLNLPAPEEYQKRKVALISGQSNRKRSTRDRLTRPF
jgi:hypothetical protein